jgi:hypothetical protein
MTYRFLSSLIAALSILALLAGCGAAAVPPTATAIPPTATALPPTATPVPPTATPLPPTAPPAVLIKLGPGKSDEPIRLVVVRGNYQLASGATLWAGSDIGVYEDWLQFTPGLAIDIGEGGVTIRGQSYPAGTLLLVNPQGDLVPRQPD